MKLTPFHKRWIAEAHWGALRRSRQLGLSFTIDRETIEELLVDYCPITRIPLDYRGGPVKPSTPCLDRIVPCLGYVPENLSVISSKANRMKSGMTQTDLRRLLRYVQGDPDPFHG